MELDIDLSTRMVISLVEMPKSLRSSGNKQTSRYSAEKDNAFAVENTMGRRE